MNVVIVAMVDVDDAGEVLRRSGAESAFDIVGE
jgi:hypothetical protein